MQYCVAKFGKEPDELHLLEDGSFKVVYSDMNCGPCEEDIDTEYFTEDCLTADLDFVYEERKRAEEKQRELERANEVLLEIARRKRDQAEKYNLYIKLKREFE